MNVNRIITLKQGESILRIVRQFWLVDMLRIFLAFLLIVAPFFLMIPLFSLRFWGLAVFVVAELAGLLLAARILMEWYWNAFIVTTRRVIDIDQRGFFSRTVSEAPYERVQDVSFMVKGIFGTFFDYGMIVVQTAGTQVNLELTHVRHPKDIHHLITETASALQAEFNGGVRSQKVAHLLDVAADLSDAEARAFLVALQEAVTHGGEGHRLSMRPLEAIMGDERPYAVEEDEEDVRVE